MKLHMTCLQLGQQGAGVVSHVISCSKISFLVWTSFGSPNVSPSFVTDDDDDDDDDSNYVL